ncbi:NlpC/P60 family protein [Bacillus sp. V5-8f]|nr:NlpC/P60 family protein [Bacillus sp. V5-8f]
MDCRDRCCFDCSGFIYYVFQSSQGITLPTTSVSLYTNVGLKYRHHL